MCDLFSLPYPGQGLVPALLNDLEVSNLDAAHREVRNLELHLLACTECAEEREFKNERGSNCHEQEENWSKKHLLNRCSYPTVHSGPQWRGNKNLEP